MTVAPAVLVALSDDEVAAIALRDDLVWASPLPTLVSVDADGLLAAAARGWRSLTIRGLIVDDDLRSDERSVIAAALANAVVVRTFCSDDAGDIVGFFPTTSFYRDESGEWLVELITPDGIHTFSHASVAASIDLLSQALHDTLTSGLDVPPPRPEGAPPASTFCVAVVHGDAVQLVMARRGVVLIKDTVDADVRVATDVAAALASAGLGA